MKNAKKWLALLLAAAMLLLSGCDMVAEILPEVVEILDEMSQTVPTDAAADITLPVLQDPEDTEPVNSQTEQPEQTDPGVDENGTYTSKEEVALYLHLYHHLPANYITKNEAQDMGWDSRSGNLDKVAPGKSIGGDRFGNYEGILPENHKYYECDIDYEGGYRNSKRIIFTKDGLVYYTEDHYETFELLYGEE